ncbi:methyltransferase [Motiliproteus sp. SC1-56]|uniref:methyltransferase n=1 Tax=Motiliproteus sp. SC1-56 TaxID=2799565 RepID=UPI001A8EEA23|nr:methyltransferase [Motiliproteus sp. SC1-56]
MTELLQAAQGQFQLSRYPLQARDPLRAWDAADELILHHLAEQPAPSEPPATLILNDSFGALTTALHAWHPQMQSDSVLAWRGTEANLRHNGLDPSSVKLLSSLDTPRGPLDLVLIKIPKTLALLEDQLHRLRPCLTPQTQVIAGAMIKHLPASAAELMQRILGPTTPSLARKKARLLFIEPDLSRAVAPPPYPTQYPLQGTPYTLLNHANVFSREKLDIGTRLLLQHLPSSPRFNDILDLGCGNGVVGLLAAQANPRARLHFVDESFMAVASARENFHRAFGDSRSATFVAGNCLDETPADSQDLILNNPPFHQQQTIGDHIAWRMFRQSRDCLRAGGELWVIGNRHLGYHLKLKKLFGNCQTVASNPKFVLLRSRKT